MSRGWLIDTNIVSEWVKPRPDAGIVSWLDEVDEDRVFLSVVSLAEIRFGCAEANPYDLVVLHRMHIPGAGARTGHIISETRLA